MQPRYRKFKNGLNYVKFPPKDSATVSPLREDMLTGLTCKRHLQKLLVIMSRTCNNAILDLDHSNITQNNEFRSFRAPSLGALRTVLGFLHIDLDLFSFQ